MAQYQLKITIQAVRLPDPIPAPVVDRDKDPIMEMTKVMRESMAPLRQPPAYLMGPFRQSGLNLDKEVEITAESFAELARVMGQFDELADRIQCSNPVENS